MIKKIALSLTMFAALTSQSAMAFSYLSAGDIGQQSLAHSAAQQVNTFGVDDRRAILPGTQEDTQLSGVGVILKDGFADATGFLLERNDIVVTTAHSFYADGRLKPGHYTFSPANNSADAVTITEKDIVFVGTTTPRLEPWRDWAIVKLNQPVPAHYKPFRYWVLDHLAFADVRKNVKLVAYHQDLIKTSNRTRRYVSDRCSLKYKERGDFFRHIERVYLHDCDFDVVSSGGPVVTRYGSEYHVIGINAGFFVPDFASDSPRRLNYSEFNGALNPNYALSFDEEMSRQFRSVMRSIDLDDQLFANGRSTFPRTASGSNR